MFYVPSGVLKTNSESSTTLCRNSSTDSLRTGFEPVGYLILVGSRKKLFIIISAGVALLYKVEYGLSKTH